MPGTCEGQDLQVAMRLETAVAAAKKKSGRGRLPRNKCDENYCFVEATGGKKCRPGKCSYSGQEHDKVLCKERVAVKGRMTGALQVLTQALDDAKRDGVITAEERARIRDLRAWLKKLEKER